MLVVVLMIFVVTTLYLLLQNQYNYWSKRGVPGPTPLPLVGNIGKYIIKKCSLGEVSTEIYRNYEGYPFVGIYKARTPCLLIRDLDFIKNITVKDFKCFVDNERSIDKNVDPLFGRNPFVLKGDEWRRSRSQLTPCFTSGKMKSIFPLVNEVSKRLLKYMTDRGEELMMGVEVKRLCTMFSVENIAVCAFGIEAKCFELSDSEFKYLAQNCVKFSGLKLVLLFVAPALINFMSTKFIPQNIQDSIIDIVKNTMNYRKENSITRNDFIELIIGLMKTVPNFTEIDVAAHAVSFLTDGFETSSHVMSYLLFDLASNPEAQAKLRKEINKSLEKNDHQFTFESIQEMSYLDACLNESMRKHAPVFQLSKVCTEKYTYTPSNPEYKNISVTVEPGTTIIIPVQALHSDSKHFKSPEKFLPERFLDKGEVPKYAYLPFGEGPRNCLGQRFAIVQIKVAIAHIVKKFEMKLNQQTQLPLKYKPWYILPSPVGGLWVNFGEIQS